MNQSERLAAFLQEGLARQEQWQSRWPAWQPDESLLLSDATVREILERLILRLEENYPFWHPDYAGQMIKPPHDIALLAYFLTQRINPNNHALDGGPATAQMEKEVVAALASLFGYPQSLGHLTSSGTIANLEALWVARELAPGKAIACSREAHYTHRRMGQVLGVETIQIATGADGRMDLDDLRAKLREGRIGTVVMTAGTTATGAVDPIDEAIELQRELPFRMHVDAAYGGFFRLLAGPDGPLPPRTAAALRAIEASDSVVVDPHKHGLQPYGCGSVLFRDPAVGRFYQHDSPYTYFTSSELHLGEISLECSRPGAAAAAFWATLQAFPLHSPGENGTKGPGGGLGAVLRRTREAAIDWAARIAQEGRLRLLSPPELDLVTFYPVVEGARVSEVSRLVRETFEALMADAREPVYLALFQASPALFGPEHRLEWDAPAATIFRSVLLKPEHAARIPSIHQRLLSTLERIHP
jgi:glutamate/tyrosine decarboxylase-like PLP-dependent enzyme